VGTLLSFGRQVGFISTLLLLKTQKEKEKMDVEKN